MADRPILFSAPMVRALLEGRKTQTRRLAWREMTEREDRARTIPQDVDHTLPSLWQLARPGDMLWVRESWRASYCSDLYREDLGRCPRPSDLTPGEIVEYLADPGATELGGKSRVSIHMPRWASRLTLEVTAARREPLTEISESDAIAEGIQEFAFKCFAFNRGAGPSYDTGRLAYAGLWKVLHGEDSWKANPEVVAITFTVHKQNIDALLKQRRAA